MKFHGFKYLIIIWFQTRINRLSARAVDKNDISLPEAESQCIRDLNLNGERIRRLGLQQINPENDDEYNKFLECSWKKVKLQDDNGRIDYDALWKHVEELATSTLRNVEEAYVEAVKQVTRGAVTYCQQNPSGGTSHGQIIVKTCNCVMKKFNEFALNYIRAANS